MKSALVRPVRIVCAVVILFWFQLFAGKTGHVVADLFNYDGIDPYDVFAANCVHHLVMFAVSLLVIILLTKSFALKVHFGLGNKDLGKKFVLIFTLICVVMAVGSHIFMKLNNNLPKYEFPLKANPIIGTIVFQLLFTGPAEELMYRMLPIGILALAIESKQDSSKTFTSEVLLAAFLFACAHMKWTFSPFNIQFDLFAIAYAFAMGVVQGVAYHTCKSIAYPMLMHSISNVLMVTTGYVFVALST